MNDFDKKMFDTFSKMLMSFKAMPDSEKYEKSCLLAKKLFDAAKKLDDESIDKLIFNKDYSLLLHEKPKRSAKSSKLPFHVETVVQKLQTCQSRTEGEEILTAHCNMRAKKHFQEILNFIHVSHKNSDKVKDLIDKVIQNTIGNRLASGSIQNFSS